MAVPNPVARKGGSTSSAIKSNASAARSVAAGSASGCPFCKRQGVPILPLRYALIPNYLDSRRGKTSLQAIFGRASALGDVPQLQQHRYTVRTLREGYLYVYLNRPGQWQVYAVTPDGNLRLLADADDMDEKAGKEMSAQCKRAGDNIPASFLHIKDVKRTPVIWLAFSTARWSAAVRGKYEKAPAKRMQKFDVSKLDSAPDGELDAFELNDDTVTRLDGWVEEFLPEGATPDVRRTYGSRSVGDLSRGHFTWKSAHGHHPRQNQAEALHEYAHCYRTEHSDKHKVAAVVLHDAMGMVQEADASRLERLESMRRYAEARARPLTVSRSILGLKQIIEQSALAARVADETKKGISDVVTETYIIPDDLPSQTQRIAVTTTRKERAAADSRKVWGDLAKRYDEATRAKFQTDYDAVMKAYAQELTACDADWAAWAQEPAWKAWLDDYDPKQYSECARFTQDYARCLAGGAAGEKSTTVWQAWLQGQPDMPGNPVYRALFFNQQSLLEHLAPQGGNLNKGDKLYDSIKGLVTSDEFTGHVTPVLKAAVATVQTALAGAWARVETTLDAANAQLSDTARDTVLRAQQGVVLLYEGVEMTLLRVRMTVGEYQSLLSDLAFRKMDTLAKKMAVKAQKFVDASGRQVRSMALAGLLRIDDSKVRGTVIEVLLWTFDKAEDVQQQISKALQDARTGIAHLSSEAGNIAHAGGALAATASREMRLGMVVLSEATAAKVGGLRAGVRLSARQINALTREFGGKALRVAGSGGVVLAAGSLFFQGWALRDSIRGMDKTLGSSATESQLGVLSPAVGLVGAAAEGLGFGMKALGKQFGEKLVVGGGVVAALASLVDAVQCGFAAVRTGRKGDTNAAYAYGAAAVFFGFGAAFGGYAAIASTSALLGPLGIALALIALGVIAVWMALNAEDTQAEIWLDRCYFGLGQRSEGKWSDAQVGDELAALNAILVGLSAKMSFSDDWLGLAERVSGYERIDVEIRIAGFDASKAGYEWRLFARHEKRGEIPMMGDRLRVPAPPQYISAAPERSLFDWMKRDDPQKWTREFEGGEPYMEDQVLVIRKSVEVLRSKFQQARLAMDYWPDYADQGALAHIDLEDQD